MRYNPIHFIRSSILCLAGYAILTPLAPVTVFGQEPKSEVSSPPKIDHILLEVSDLNASIAFYRDFVGLRLKSQSDWFVMLESGNVGVFLRNSHWDWEKPRTGGEQPGLGMYPHFEVRDAAAMVEKARKAGYRIVQEPRKYDFGTEAFIADPDGYTWAFVSPPKAASSR
jgi:catechol 2,3-dioxygenase-like lactoylglutathione lyase family enzyme